MSSGLGRISAITLALAAVSLLSDSASQPSQAQPADDKKDDKAKPAAAPAAKAASNIQPQKFDHNLEDHKSVVSADNCKSCHGDDPKGALAVPAKTGHQPCLAANCHVTEFISVGADTKTRDPVRYERAVGFCLGCHNSKTHEPPKNYTKAKADHVYHGNAKPNYHVEFNHFEHTTLTSCSSCHIVNARTYELELDTPGHRECANCHGNEGAAASVGKKIKPMSDCAQCHSAPGPGEYFTGQRKGSETRSCGSPTHRELARKRKDDEIPCFKHERREHRFKRRKPLDCGTCHFMIGNRGTWDRKEKYETIRDIRSAPIIHNKRDLAHDSCGQSRACHKRDVDDSRGSAQCRLCHSQKTIDNDLFEP